MPNKFSHSVVLAHYSSLGLIDLPDSQRIAYSNSNSSQPTDLKTPSAASKAQPTSSKAPHGGEVNENARQTSYSDQASQGSAPAQPAGSSQTSRQRVIIDTDEISQDSSTLTQVDEREKVYLTFTSRTDTRSAQRNSRQHGVQPVTASSSGHRGLVNGKRGSRAIQAENVASSETFPVSHSYVVSERGHVESRPATSRPAASKSASDRLKDPRKIRSQSQLQQTCLTPTPQTSGSPRVWPSSQIEPAISKATSLGRSLQPAPCSRDLSGRTPGMGLYDQLPEAANLDRLEDAEQMDESQKSAKLKPGLASKVGSSATSGWSFEAELARRQQDESNHWRQRKFSLDPTSPQTNTSEPMSSHNRDMSNCGSYDSLSSLSSFNLTLLEDEQQKKGVASRSKRPAGASNHLSTANRDHKDSYSPSLFELGPSTRDSARARHLGHVRRDLAPRQSIDSDRDHEADASPNFEASVNFPPNIAMYRVEKAFESPLAQVEMMLRKREEETNMRDGLANQNISLSKEEKIKEAEKTLRELKKSRDLICDTADSYQDANSKVKKEGGRFFQRFRGQK